MSRSNREESATPARNTRARSGTPLPSIATKQSHAYGAKGKTSLHTQVRASDGDFAEEFTTATATAAASPAKKGGSRKRGGRAEQPETILEGRDDDEEDEPAVADEQTDPGRLQTGLGRGMGYAADPVPAGQGAGMVQAVQEPSVWRVSFRALPRWARLLVPRSADGPLQKFTEMFVAALLFLCVAGIVYAWLPLSGKADSVRFSVFWTVGRAIGLPGYVGPAAWAMEMWFRTMEHNLTATMVPDHNVPEIQWGINMNVLARLGASEIDQEDLRSILGLQTETLDYLKSILPVTVVLQDDEEQRLSIPQPFWEALSQRIAQGGDEVSPLWDSFISSNQKEILELSLNAASTIVDEAVENKQLVTAEAFAQALSQHNLDLAERYTQDYRRMWEQNFETVREVAQKTTEETMEKFTTISMVKQQLDVLAKAVDLSNTYEALRTYNWFTFGEGAIINPRLTSPTAEPPNFQWFGKFWSTSRPFSYMQKPPVTVLAPWDEVTDCWCAAPAKDGSAQISMIMMEGIYPDRLMIEHMPAGGTRRIANAPRTIEVWGDVGSKAEAKRLSEVMEETVPYPSQHACTKRPSNTHICLARGTYNIHHHNHVQSLEIWTDAKNLEIAVHSFTIRIVNNWGRTADLRLSLAHDRRCSERDERRGIRAVRALIQHSATDITRHDSEENERLAAAFLA